MEELKFANRVKHVQKSFIREILKVASRPDIISFAGGLPNKELFPVDALSEGARRVLSHSGKEVLQYSNSEGYLPLREWIANRYAQKGMPISPENILITNGSQQGLDLISKVFLNEGDSVLIEKPGYLGAIQAFSLFQAAMHAVRLEMDGPNVDEFRSVLKGKSPVLSYLIPNFQNPSGVSYSQQKREAIATLVASTSNIIVEDDPYGELQFIGERQASFFELLPKQTILLGTFSKIVIPSFRLGWIVAPPRVMDRLLVAKQAADLHTDYFAQRLMFDYLEHHDIDDHIALIRKVYGRQAKKMVACIKASFPEGTRCSSPNGGMFMWIELPDKLSSTKLFERCIRRNVAFVPGTPFYIGAEDSNCMRLNFSCSNEETIEQGIQVISEELKIMMQ